MWIGLITINDYLLFSLRWVKIKCHFIYLVVVYTAKKLFSSLIFLVFFHSFSVFLLGRWDFSSFSMNTRLKTKDNGNESYWITTENTVISFHWFSFVFDYLVALRSKSWIRINAHWCWPCQFYFRFTFALSILLLFLGWVFIEYVRFFAVFCLIDFCLFVCLRA